MLKSSDVTLKSSKRLFSTYNSNILILMESGQFLLRVHNVLGIFDSSQDLYLRED